MPLYLMTGRRHWRRRGGGLSELLLIVPWLVERLLVRLRGCGIRHDKLRFVETMEKQERVPLRPFAG